jgi:probable rRNA maturation factor
MLKQLGWRRAGLSVVFVTDAQIRKLHRQYTGDDRPTDVLAFGQMEGKFFPQVSAPFLGDVVVSVETARRAAPRYGNRWDQELLLYLCHGILHLMGYRDSTPRLKAKMDKKQDQMVKLLLGKAWRSKKRKRLF